MTTKKLSRVQEKVLFRLSYEWQSAYDLCTSLATMDALVHKGYAMKQFRLGSCFSSRTSIFYKKSAVECEK